METALYLFVSFAVGYLAAFIPMHIADRRNDKLVDNSMKYMKAGSSVEVAQIEIAKDRYNEEKKFVRKMPKVPMKSEPTGMRALEQTIKKELGSEYELVR